MMLTVNSSKTFDKILEEKPDLYNGIAGYTWSSDENKWVNTGVSDITKSLIEDWFGMRKVCDDDNFERFFKRKMNITALRYAQLSRIELSAFDPLVADYVEREVLAENSKTAAGKVDKTASGTTSGTTGRETTRTPNLTEVIDRDTTGSHSTTEGGSDETEHEGSQQTATGGSDTVSSKGHTEDTHKEANKVAPQSISYSGGSGASGKLPTFDWEYMTSQAQADNDADTTSSSTTQHGTTTTGSDGSKDTTTYGKTEQGTTSGTDDQTRKQTGNEKTVVSGTSSGTTSQKQGVESSGTESGRGQTHEIETGRHGLTPQEAFRTAVSYLKTSSAFEWLSRELDECFMSVYDI